MLKIYDLFELSSTPPAFFHDFNWDPGTRGLALQALRPAWCSNAGGAATAGGIFSG